MNLKPRNNLISFLQVFGIILVVSGHSGLGIPYYSFHMQLFMFISGYLQRYTRDDYTQLRILPTYRRKFERLLIPYFLFTVVAWIPKIFMKTFIVSEVDFSWELFFKSFFYADLNPILPFWFLPAIFTIFIIVLPLLKYFNYNKVLIPLAVISLAAIISGVVQPEFFNIGLAIKFLFWWISGFYFAIYGDKIIRWLKLGSWYSTLILLGGIFAVGYIPETFVTPVLNPIPGILFCISFGLIYIRRDWKALNHLYGYSFSIYLMHWFFQVMIRILFRQTLYVPDWLFWLLCLVAGIYLPWIVAKTVKKYWGDKYFVKAVFGL